MGANHQRALVSVVQERRNRRGLSQSDLAEAAGLSTKTIQRLEAGKAVLPGSRRAVLSVLDIEPEDLDLDSPVALQQPWTRVDDASALFMSLAATREVDVEIDRNGWRRARRQRPWYRQDLVFATKDPVHRILELVDRATEFSQLPPGRKAKDHDDLAKALRAAEAVGWQLASRVDEHGRLSLHIGSSTTVAKRLRKNERTDGP